MLCDHSSKRSASLSSHTQETVWKQHRRSLLRGSSRTNLTKARPKLHSTACASNLCQGSNPSCPLEDMTNLWYSCSLSAKNVTVITATTGIQTSSAELISPEPSPRLTLLFFYTEQFKLFLPKCHTRGYPKASRRGQGLTAVCTAVLSHSVGCTCVVHCVREQVRAFWTQTEACHRVCVSSHRVRELVLAKVPHLSDSRHKMSVQKDSQDHQKYLSQPFHTSTDQSSDEITSQFQLGGVSLAKIYGYILCVVGKKGFAL